MRPPPGASHEHNTRAAVRGGGSRKHLSRPTFPARRLIGADGNVVWETDPAPGVRPEAVEEEIEKALDAAENPY